MSYSHSGWHCTPACLVVALSLFLLIVPASAARSAPLSMTPPAIAAANPVDLSVALAALDNVAPGIDTTFPVYIRNNDPAASATEVRVSVTLPGGVIFNRSYNSDGDVAPISTAGGVITYLVGTLNADESTYIALDIHLPAALPGTAFSILADTQSANPDPDLANNHCELAFNMPAADMTVSLAAAYDSPAPVAGYQTAFWVYYANIPPGSEATSTELIVDLPAGLALHTATWSHSGAQEPISPNISGGRLAFHLGAIPAGDEGSIHLLLNVAATVRNHESLLLTASISTTAIELVYENNHDQYVVNASVDAPDLWVVMTGDSGEQIDSWQHYTINYGNSGVKSGSSARLQLALPNQLGNVTYDPAPTSMAGNLATWDLGAIGPNTDGEIWVDSTVQATGFATAAATFTALENDGNESDNMATVQTYLAGLKAPTLGGPILSLISPYPAIFGSGEPGATVTLWVSDSLSYRDLGTTMVDPNGAWVYTSTTALRVNDWSWIVARQAFDAQRISLSIAAPNFVADGLPLDPNSLVRNGERWGGIDQTHWWSVHEVYTIGGRITACPDPTDQSLLVEYFNAADQIVHSTTSAPTFTGPNGYVEFQYQPPENMPFNMYFEWTCPADGGEDSAIAAPANQSAGKRGKQGAQTDTSGWRKCGPGCWQKIPPKPQPKPDEPPLAPLVPPDVELAPLVPLKPQGTDPDGFVYDAALVAAGATVPQAIVTRAWVTATQETAPGVWTLWDAAAENQTNPQYTDSQYADQVLKPGYYAFIVQPGNYRIQVRAPGYAPCSTEILTVLDKRPVTRHIGLIPLGGAAHLPGVVYGLYLPAVRK